MVPAGVSDGALQFVQHCQVAVLTCADDDAVAQVGAIWRCLSTFPRASDEDDLASAAVAVSKVARGFFEPHRVGRTPHERVPMPRRRHANAVLQLLREHYGQEDLTLKTTAAQMGLSEAHLSRILRRELGGSFGSAFRAHLNGIRLLAAIRQLPSGRSFQVIAKEVGYPNTGELDRQFHRWFGVNPRAFRSYLRRAPEV